MDYPSEDNHYQSQHALLIANSYRFLLGKELLSGVQSPDAFAQALFEAPIVIISHDTAQDPILNYANQKALALFEMSWDELTRTPSRFTSEATGREKREKLLAEVKAKGYVEPFHGTRISKNGKRFYVREGAVWNLIDTEGRYRGQAACFFQWNDV
ncbi:MAG: MEKHLA domain-containing protein [Gammaproteobacteria bacterium]